MVIKGEEKMNVLSLFDGMSCGQLALQRSGIQVNKYYASEIDKYAIKIAQKNFPNTVQLGDVQNVKSNYVDNIDLLIGGSPCQGFSFAGRQLNFEDPRSKLFFEYVRLLDELKPKYFLLENVKMKKESEAVITKYLGVEPIMINSALVSAQNRQRLYWTNIPGVTQPEDKGIVLKHILQDYVEDKYLIGEELANKYQGGNQLNPSYKSQANTIHNVEEKSGTICAGTHGYANGYVDAKYFMNETQIAGVLKSNYRERKPMDINRKSNCLKVGGDIKRIITQEKKWRYLTPIECERLQTVPDNYTQGVSNTQRYKMLGNGWTIDVIAHILKNIKEVNNV